MTFLCELNSTSSVSKILIISENIISSILIKVTNLNSTYSSDVFRRLCNLVIIASTYSSSNCLVFNGSGLNLLSLAGLAVLAVLAGCPKAVERAYHVS